MLFHTDKEELPDTEPRCQLFARHCLPFRQAAFAPVGLCVDFFWEQDVLYGWVGLL